MPSIFDFMMTSGDYLICTSTVSVIVYFATCFAAANHCAAPLPKRDEVTRFSKRIITLCI